MYTSLKAAFAAIIATQGRREITASQHRTAINNVIDELGKLQFKGVATTSTDPGTPDGPAQYIAGTVGVYTHFNDLTVSTGEVAMFKRETDGIWVKETLLTDIGSQSAIDTIETAITALEGKTQAFETDGKLGQDLDAANHTVKNVKDAVNPGDVIPNGQIQPLGTNGLKLWSEKYGTYADGLKLIGMIKSVFIHNPTASKSYGIRLLNNNHATYGYLIRIDDHLGNNLGFPDITSQVTNPGGLNHIYGALNDGSLFEMVIDYSLYLGETVINTAVTTNYLWIDKSRYIKSDYNLLNNIPTAKHMRVYKYATALITLATGTTLPSFIVPSNVAVFNYTFDNGSKVWFTLKAKTYEFTAPYTVLGIDLTATPPSVGSATVELVEKAYTSSSLFSKDFYPVAYYWNGGNNVNFITFNPEIEQLVDLTKTTKISRITNLVYPIVGAAQKVHTHHRTEPSVFYNSVHTKVNITEVLNSFADGFEGKAYKLNATSASNLWWMYEPGVALIDNISDLFIEFDYKIVTGTAKLYMWIPSSSGTWDITQITLDVTSTVKRTKFKIPASNIATNTAGHIVNYFALSNGGELWVGNVKAWQGDEFIIPTSEKELSVENARALNSVVLTEQLVNNVFGSTPVHISSPKKQSIVLSGSSITWGDGNLDDRFIAEVDAYIKSELSTIVKAEDMTFGSSPTAFANPKCYSTAQEISGLNETVSFDLYGDEIAICQAIRRTTDWAKMQVKADGVVIGTFTNHNRTIGSDTDNFTGNSTNVKFMLSHPYTYNHAITVDGVSKTAAIATSRTDTHASRGVDVLIVRKLDANGMPVHMAWFATAPAAVAVVIDYEYGKVIFHEGSTVGQIGSDDESNEMNYGEGSVSFDPANPASLSSGMEFRAIDKRAFWVHKFTTKAYRTFEIEIVDGTNPYFICDFASNRFHNLMNAGIGGWALAELLNSDSVNDYNNFFQYFMPDVIVNESATNDDWSYGARRISRTLTGLTEAEVKLLWTLELASVTYISADNFTVVKNTGIITAISTFSLTCAEIVGSGVIVGDIVRIGNYFGDNKQVAVREIETVDTGTGVITWLEPLYSDQILNISAISDLVGAECSVRDLSAYQTNYVTLIEKIQKIAPQAQILLTQPGLSNYFLRQLWGYEIVHRRLAALYHNVSTIEITDLVYDFQNGNITGSSYENITATGVSEYNLVKTGHWQGFKVIVNGVDVYGKDCYIQSGWGYSVDQSGTGAALNVTGVYDKTHTANGVLKLVFFQNEPVSGTIRVEYANSVWSSDFCHTDAGGAYVYGQAYIAKLKDLLN